MQRVRSPQSKDCMLPPLLPLSAMDEQCHRVGTWVNWWMSRRAQSSLDLWLPTFWICPLSNMMLLLLSRFSRVWLCATPLTAAHQTSLSLGFSRQEHWSGLPFPSPMHESESEVAQSCPTLSDPMDCSLPGSSVHGIFQVRVLEWGAIAFASNQIRDTPWGWRSFTSFSHSMHFFEIEWDGVCHPQPYNNWQEYWFVEPLSAQGLRKGKKKKS